MNELTAEDVAAVLIGIPLPLIVIWTVVTCQILAEPLERIFTNSPLIQNDRKVIEHFGLLGKVMTCGSVFWICLTPRRSVSRGLAIANEIRSVPKRTKYWLYPPFISLYLWFFALLISGVIYGWWPD